MYRIAFYLFLTLFIVSVSCSCHGEPVYGPDNPFPISEFSNSHKMVKEVPNGKLYEVEVSLPTPTTFDIVHVWGTPYEMGYASGSLHDKNKTKVNVEMTWTEMEETIESYIPHQIPKWLDDMIANFGLKVALDLTYELTKDWTNPRIHEELKGYADATGIDYKLLVRVHLIPSLVKGACSMIGAWDESIDQSSCDLLQMRTFDWNFGRAFTDYPQIMVYHPNSGNGHAFLNIAWRSFIGGTSGMSSARLGISCIGVGYPDSTFGSTSRIGVPVTFLLRDILQYDINLQNATDRMINTRRTCDNIIGIGDGNEKTFNAFQYSHSVLNAFSWDDQRPLASWHPRIKKVVYYGYDWDCPTYQSVLANRTMKYWGQLSPQIAISKIVGVLESGKNHAAFFSFSDSKGDDLFVSFAAPEGTTGNRAAYARQFTRIPAGLLWNEKKPDL